jgi:DNA-binding NtrC family response regulator
MKRILTVEDETVIRNALKRLLERNGYAISEAGSVHEATSNYDLSSFDLIISDLRLPGTPGTEMIKLAGEVPVLIMTSYASLRSAVDSMKMGAVDYIAKPFDHDEMLAAVEHIISSRERAKAELQLDPRTAPGDTRKVEGIIGDCQPMLKLYEHIHKVAPRTSTVLIHGETGTGKELVAKAIHRESLRAAEPMICVNCAAIPETLIESELFGYEKGAFTGAQTSRTGLIEAADGGTLFLDEIGELPIEAQARLLRFIQEGEIRRIGSVQSRKVDVRLITATHRDLKRLSEEGRFRQDLYYRINVMKLELPSLRDRGKDILTLAEKLLERYCDKMDIPQKHFSPSAIQAITTYRWPGNVREMENVIERAVILADDNEINHDLLAIDLDLVQFDQIRDSERQPRINKDPVIDAAEEGLSLEDYFQRFIMEHQDSMSETELARKLGVSRKSLWERRKRLGIPRKKGSKPDEMDALDNEEL